MPSLFASDTVTQIGDTGIILSGGTYKDKSGDFLRLLHVEYDLSQVREVQSIATVEQVSSYDLSEDSRSILTTIDNSEFSQVLVYRRQSTAQKFPEAPSFSFMCGTCSRESKAPIYDPFACTDDTCALIRVNTTALALVSVPLLSQQGQNMSILSVLSLPLSLLPPAPGGGAPTFGFPAITWQAVSPTSMVIRIAAPVSYPLPGSVYNNTLVLWESSPLPLDYPWSAGAPVSPQWTLRLLPSLYPTLYPSSVSWRSCGQDDGCTTGRIDLMVYWIIPQGSSSLPCLNRSNADWYRVDSGLNVSNRFQTLSTPCVTPPEPDWDVWLDDTVAPAVASKGSAVITFDYAYGYKQCCPPPEDSPPSYKNAGILWGAPPVPTTPPDALLVPVEVIVVLCGLGLALPFLCGVWKVWQGMGGMRTWRARYAPADVATKKTASETTTLLSMSTMPAYS